MKWVALVKRSTTTQTCITSSSAGQTDYKVHPNLIPFPLRNLQYLQQTCGPLIFCLDPLTTVASGHILCYLSFHTVPPESLLQVLVHFLATRVYRICCLMGFLENQFPDRFDVGNAQPILEQSLLLHLHGNLDLFHL
jgi:hypothetical protein